MGASLRLRYGMTQAARNSRHAVTGRYQGKMAQTWPESALYLAACRVTSPVHCRVITP